jgi:hypothetical protein
VLANSFTVYLHSGDANGLALVLTRNTGARAKAHRAAVRNFPEDLSTLVIDRGLLRKGGGEPPHSTIDR